MHTGRLVVALVALLGLGAGLLVAATVSGHQLLAAIGVACILLMLVLRAWWWTEP
jgi:hypothetical protein